MVNLCELEDKFDSSKVEVSGASRNNGLSMNPNLCVESGDVVDSCKVNNNSNNNLRSLFVEVLSIFLKELCVNKHHFRPFPPKLGDEQAVDLFKLFWEVRKVGGYESVSKIGMWGFLAEKCGVDVKLRAPLKLIYFDYLKEFDEHLRHETFKYNDLGNGKIEIFKLFSQELETYSCFEFDDDDEKSSAKDDKRVLRFHSNEVTSHKSREDLGDEAAELEKNKKIHPLIYDEDQAPVRLSPKRKRCSQRLMARSSLLKNADKTPEIILIEDDDDDDDNDNSSPENPESKSVKIGPCHQAEVPVWTGMASESDPKWVGTRTWPSPGQDPTGPEEAGKGRAPSCECPFRGSVDCVRFHVAESRLKARRALGALAFHEWKLNAMGEEVSLGWDREEEDEFKSLVMKARQEFDYTRKSKQGIMRSFWRGASRLIPAKTKEDLVSYYFNVFVLRRRGYQNRVTPGEIDSDDDETEMGSVGDRFGYERVHGLSLKVKCCNNMQCIEFGS